MLISVNALVARAAMDRQILVARSRSMPSSIYPDNVPDNRTSVPFLKTVVDFKLS